MVAIVESGTILVVEDEADIRDLLNDLLTLEGFSVLTAATPALALDMFARSQPDLILMDLMLPGMSGFELAESIRSRQQVPIVAMSASNFLLREAERWPHFVATIAKPFDWDALLSHLQGFVG